jgi:hypothetical protein
VADRLGLGAGRPLEGCCVGGTVSALFYPAPDGGGLFKFRTIFQVGAEQADFLPPQQARNKQAQGNARVDKQFFHSF